MAKASSGRFARALHRHRYHAGRAGCGAGRRLSVQSDDLVADDLVPGRLHPILPEWHLPSGGIYVVFPAARYRPRKVTTFVDMPVVTTRAMPERHGSATKHRGGA